jgi:hypothetical protein
VGLSAGLNTKEKTHATSRNRTLAFQLVAWLICFGHKNFSIKVVKKQSTTVTEIRLDSFLKQANL